jgi:RNA polymerase sigma-70 factor, ECF subfamily
VEPCARTGRSAPGQAWADELGGAGQQAGEAAARLQGLLLETARTEIGRRQDQLPPDGPGPGALAQEAAAGALAAVIADLGERSQAPFTIWVAKFVMAEVSAKIAQQQWRAGALTAAGQEWAARLPARLGLAPGSEESWAGVLGSLRRGIAEDLTEQQRMVFQSVLLGGVPIDVLALEFGSSRSAVYKSLFEARRRLGDRLAAAGHDPDPLNPLPSGWPSGLASLLSVTPGDPGCEVAFQQIDTYVGSELCGRDPGQQLAAVRVHLGSCAACQVDYQGLRAAARAARLSAGPGCHPAGCPFGRPRFVVLVTSPPGAGHHQGRIR